MVRQRLVYSTDKGKLCPACSKPVAACHCRTKNGAQTAPGDGIVRLQRQTKGRNGKPVTLITGLAISPEELKLLAKALKQRCGVGGTIEQGNILIQGDMRELLKTELEARGHKVKISGG